MALNATEQVKHRHLLILFCTPLSHTDNFIQTMGSFDSKYHFFSSGFDPIAEPDVCGRHKRDEKGSAGLARLKQKKQRQ